MQKVSNGSALDGKIRYNDSTPEVQKSMHENVHLWKEKPE